MPGTETPQIVAELVAIKKLLILIMLKNDYTQRDVANALGVNQSAVSRMFAKAGKQEAGKTEANALTNQMPTGEKNE